MKYIKVTNTSTNVNRLKLEKLGFSTKRDDDQTIGQFGSGIKFAPIAAIRKGIDFVFAGQDDKGSYTLEYVIREEDGVNSIFYKYEDYEKPSSFTAEAGMLSWESDFQIIREVVANAIDESKLTNTDWNLEIVDVDKIVPIEGEFSVYLKATEELVEIVNNFDKYFSVNREPVFNSSHSYYKVKLYNSIDNVFRVYCKGVLVFATDQTFKSYDGVNILPGIFDYEFDDKLDLNEDRTVSNTFNMNCFVIKALSMVTDENLMDHVLQSLIGHNAEEPSYEKNVISNYGWDTYSYPSVEIKEHFEKNFPMTVIARINDYSTNFIQSIKTRGYDVKFINQDNAFTFYKNMGVQVYEDIFGEYFQYESTMDLSDYPVVTSAISIVKDIFPEFEEVENQIGIFFGDDEEVLALATNMMFEGEESLTKKILINNSHAENSNIKKMISTLIHEWDHEHFGVGDGNAEGRLFRSLADDKIGYLVYELWKAKKK